MGAPYRPPSCGVGAWLDDAIVGRVQVGGGSTAPLSWPVRRTGGKPAVIVTPDLVRALETESAKAIAFWWGIHKDCVRRWRRALKLPTDTPGSQSLKQALSDSRRGQPAHPDTRAALLRGATKSKPEGWGAKANEWRNQAKRDRSGEARACIAFHSLKSEKCTSADAQSLGVCTACPLQLARRAAAG